MPRNDPMATDKERLAYNVRAVVEALRDETRITDEQLEEAIAELFASLEDDGVIDRDEAMTILVTLVKAYRGNGDALGILDLWAESGTEPAQRKSERIQQKRRAVSATSKKG